MKKLSLIVVAAAILSSCEHTKPTDQNQFVADARAAAQEICQFVPTANTILEILALGVPQLDKAGKIAVAICKELASSKKGHVPRVRGVRIRGQYV